MSVQVKGSGTIGGLDEGLVISGIVTSSTQINVGSNIQLGNAGVVTATTFKGALEATSGSFSSNIDANGDLDVDGHTNLDNVSIAGITTFSNATTIVNGGYHRGIINSGAQAKIIGGYISGTDTLRIGESVYLTSTGLGINQSSPTVKLQITDTSATILRTEATANDGDALIQADGRDSSGNLRRIMMRTDAGADQYRIISSDTSYNLALCTGNAPRVLIAGSSAATSIGGSNVFNAMLTVQGDISGALFQLKATENTNRLMISGTNTSGCEMNLYDDAGAQKGIMGVSSSECFVTAPATALNLKGYSEVKTQNYITTGSAAYLERWKVYQHGTSLQPTRHGDSVETKSGGRYYVLSGATPFDGSNTSSTMTPLMRCGHSFNGTMYLWMAYNGDNFHRGCRQMIYDCQGTYGYVGLHIKSQYNQNALGAGLNSFALHYQNSGSPNYYFQVNGTWAAGQSDIPYVLWTWIGHNSDYPYAL